MKVKLKNLATVQMGYSFRYRLKIVDRGEITVIQMKDLLGSNIVDCRDLVKVDMKTVKDHHLVKKGDLVFRSRGLVNTSAILLDEPGKAVVGAPLLRIRVNSPDIILPEYLNWYISQRNAQTYFNSRAKGSAQKMISKQAIEELEISLPGLKRQKTILEMATLSTKEQILIKEIAEKREQYISKILMQLTTTESTEGHGK